MKKLLQVVGLLAYCTAAMFILVHKPVVVHAQSFPGTIRAGTAGQSAVYVGTHAIGPGGGTNAPSGEQAIGLTAWANGPTGSLDMTVAGYTYSISAASAISSFVNTRSSGSMNFSSFNVTNPGGSDLILYVTASGYVSSDGARQYTITNKTQREIRFSSSQYGVRGVTASYY